MKALIRKELLEKRDLLTQSEINLRSEIIFNKLIEHGFIKNFTKIFTYVNFGSEIITLDYLDNLKKNGYDFYIPRVNWGTKEMDIYKFENKESLSLSKYNILEPLKTHTRLIETNNLDVCITPGVAFDMNGYRLGYGGGFYDKFFYKHNNILKVGICYDEFLISQLPHNELDQKVDVIVTDKQIIDFRK